MMGFGCLKGRGGSKKQMADAFADVYVPWLGCREWIDINRQYGYSMLGPNL